MAIRTTINLVVRKVDFENNTTLFGSPDRHVYLSDTLVSLTYLDAIISSLALDVKLQEKYIPYELSWDEDFEYPAGTEYCRILACGLIHTKTYSDGDDVPSVISWEEQNIIMQGRERALAFLNKQNQDTIDALVMNKAQSVFPTCEKSASLLMATLKEEGRIKQTAYLLNKGFLPENINVHIS
jgi:hypothetical protein